MGQKNILFVDDEPNILSGLKRMLRSMRKTMNFQFAENGPSALEIMASEEIDVVVSDMRMPGMDGAELLSIVQKKYPYTIRLMLTGQADDASIMRTVGVVHQVLAKPVDPDILKQIIKRASVLQDLMENEQLKQLVSSIGNLPSRPEIYTKLQQTLKNPESALDDVANLVEQDLAMSAKILQLVNSSFFGLYKHIESPRRAVNLLGLETIRLLVLGVGVFSELKIDPSNAFNIDDLWEHSVATAAFAKTIAAHESEDEEMIGNAFVAGLLHDVGKLLLFSLKQQEYDQAVDQARISTLQLQDAELEIFGASHSDVGGYLIGLWGLPGQVVESITFHHRLDSYPEPSFCPPVITHTADYIYYHLKPGNCIGEPPQLNTSILSQIGMLDHVPKWIELCKDLQTNG